MMHSTPDTMTDVPFTPSIARDPLYKPTVQEPPVTEDSTDSVTLEPDCSTDTQSLHLSTLQTRSTSRASRSRLRLYNMHSDHSSSTNLTVRDYDPWNGVQTAGILGTALILVTAYATYKYKSRRYRWTSTDKLFMKKYKQKMEEREQQKKSLMRMIQKNLLIKQESHELTALWIQTQPLEECVVADDGLDGSAADLADCPGVRDIPNNALEYSIVDPEHVAGEFPRGRACAGQMIVLTPDCMACPARVMVDSSVEQVSLSGLSQADTLSAGGVTMHTITDKDLTRGSM